jgi:deazaflavin-dependent oxidoreductase (nitroreductase family)
MTESPRVHINDRNRELVEQFRAAGGHGPAGEYPMVLITHVGRRSGESRTNPLAAVADGNDVIIAATMGGAPKHPQWYLNVVANPDITVEWEGETFAAHAETVPAGPERERLVAALTPNLPGLPRYQERAAPHREIPIVRLVRQA